MPEDSQSRIGILVVEDNPSTRTGLEIFTLAYPDLLLLGSVATGEEAIEFCEHAEPDVIVMDIMLPGIDGVVTTEQIRRMHPTVNVVALSSCDEQDMIEKAFRAGATSYVLKTSPADKLIGVIRAAYFARGAQT